jgi:hypothetical protein
MDKSKRSTQDTGLGVKKIQQSKIRGDLGCKSRQSPTSKGKYFLPKKLIKYIQLKDIKEISCDVWVKRISC